MPDLALRQPEARLLYLATLYHLGRPGTEVDRTTRRPNDLGLAPVRAMLEAQLELAASGLVLSEQQLHLLSEGLLGLVNELKQIGLSGRSVMPGLVEAVTRLYPEVTPDDPAAALDLAGEATLLHRRLDVSIHAAAMALDRHQAPPTATTGAWRGWRFWRR